MERFRLAPVHKQAVRIPFHRALHGASIASVQTVLVSGIGPLVIDQTLFDSTNGVVQVVLSGADDQDEYVLETRVVTSAGITIPYRWTLEVAYS